MGTSKCSLACRECKSYAAHVAEMLSKKQRFMQPHRLSAMTRRATNLRAGSIARPSSGRTRLRTTRWLLTRPPRPLMGSTVASMAARLCISERTTALMTSMREVGGYTQAALV